tara:strand:- start:5922 stop:6350 length:429 start_codon:yes stop_codon:yes gene_type:complete
MMMNENFKILAKYIKDMSSETPSTETYLFVKDNISKYQLGIKIDSKAIKNQLIEVNTNLRFEDKDNNKLKSYFEISYITIVKVDEKIKDKDVLQKIILCNVQKEIYNDLEKSMLNLLHNSGYEAISFDKKIDFDELYQKNFN